MIAQSVGTLKFHYFSYSVCSSVLEEEGDKATGFPHPFFSVHLKRFLLKLSERYNSFYFSQYGTLSETGVLVDIGCECTI
jgi:hypothetical protein